MAYMLARIHVDDYDAWKPMFDSDPAKARVQARGHRLFRALEDPNEVFVQVEFASEEDARAAHEKLIASGALERVTVKSPPTVAVEAEAVGRA